MEKYYTPDQVAEILMVSAKTIREWLKKGRLKGSKLGPRLWRISETDLQKFVDRGKAAQQEEDSDT
jgi:excisionase family DNA binding protein